MGGPGSGRPKGYPCDYCGKSGHMTRTCPTAPWTAVYETWQKLSASGVLPVSKVEPKPTPDPLGEEARSTARRRPSGVQSGTGADWRAPRCVDCRSILKLGHAPTCPRAKPEEPTVRTRSVICAVCGKSGHNRQTCRENPRNEWKWELERRKAERRTEKASRGVGPSGRSPNYQRAQDFAVLYRNGLTYTQIGAKYGVSRERVRQVLAKTGFDGRAAKARANRERIEAERLSKCLAVMQRAIDEDRKCTICGAWVLRKGPAKTCSQACAELLRGDARLYVRPEQREQHRFNVAKSILRNPKGKRPSQIAWAKRMLSDNPPPANRRFSVPGSRASEAARKLGIVA